MQVALWNVWLKIEGDGEGEGEEGEGAHTSGADVCAVSKLFSYTEIHFSEMKPVAPIYIALVTGSRGVVIRGVYRYIYPQNRPVRAPGL